MPLKPILVLLGILFGIVILMYASIQMYIKKKLTEMGATGKADASIYAKRYQRSGSRLIIVTLAIFLVCVIFLAVVFLAFA